MGQAMARNLLKAGHKVTVYNRTREKAEALAADGAAVAGSIAEAAMNEIVNSFTVCASVRHGQITWHIADAQSRTTGH
jgi:3-hydroxyisobutyrate dehydrogenase-like beta-hydroxyacid dehydrogenase